METKTVSRTFNEYEDFNVGDVVRLKSGGPNMTVDAVLGSRLSCIWFYAGSIASFNRQDFDQGALEKVAPAQQLAEARALAKAAEAEACAAIREENPLQS